MQRERMLVRTHAWRRRRYRDIRPSNGAGGTHVSEWVHGLAPRHRSSAGPAAPAAAAATTTAVCSRALATISVFLAELRRSATISSVKLSATLKHLAKPGRSRKLPAGKTTYAPANNNNSNKNMFSRRRSTQEPQQQSQPRTGLFRRRDTAPAVPSPSAPASRSTPAAAADPAATLPSPPQSPPVPHTGPAAPLTAAVTQPPSHLTQLPPQAHDVPPHQLASPPQSPPLAPRQYARPPPPPPAGWHPPHQTSPAHPPPPHYRPPHVANLTELEGGTAQPNPLLPPGPDGTIMGMTSEQLEARHAAVAASPLGQLASFLDRFDPPPPPPPRQAPDARLAESMANMFISRGADPAAVRPHAGELAAAMAQATALMNTRAEEDAYARHRAAWHAANPKKGLFGTRPRTPPLPPLRAEDRADPEEYLAHMLHGGGLLQAPVPGCKYCAPMAAMRDGHARQYDEHQARLRRGREERWAVRVQSWRATYGREYDHARAAAVPDRFGNGWEYLEGGAAWDAEEARLRALEPRYSTD